MRHVQTFGSKQLVPMTVHSGVCALTFQLQKHHAGRCVVTETVSLHISSPEWTTSRSAAGKLSVIAFSKSGLCQVFHEAYGGLHQGNKYVCIYMRHKKASLGIFFSSSALCAGDTHCCVSRDYYQNVTKASFITIPLITNQKKTVLNIRLQIRFKFTLPSHFKGHIIVIYLIKWHHFALVSSSFNNLVQRTTCQTWGWCVFPPKK